MSPIVVPGERVRRNGVVAIVAMGLTLIAGFIVSAPSPGRGTVPLVPPNIVLINTDDQALAELEFMPRTNDRTDWVRFNRALVENPLCCPSRATQLTGRYDFRTKVIDNEGRNFRAENTLATWLDDAGYTNGLFGKYLNGYPFSGQPLVPPGWDAWAAFDTNDPKAGLFYDYTLIEGTSFRGYGSLPFDYSTDVISNKADAFLRNTSGPFFLYFNPRAPHPPETPAFRHERAPEIDWRYPPSFNEADVSDKPPWLRRLDLRKPGDIEFLIQKRHRSLLSVDEAVERIFDTLAQTGALDNTYVIFTSDNGFMLGEHRLGNKSCPYEECIRVPLLIRGPGLEPREISEQVSNIDLAPTIAELAGVEPGLKVQGVSMLPLMHGRTYRSPRPVLIHGRPPAEVYREWWGVVTKRFKLIRTVNGFLELYDLEADPFELQNVADRPKYAGVVEELLGTIRLLKRR